MKSNNTSKPRNHTALAMAKRHGSTTTQMRDRRDRRPKDARRKAEWMS